VAAPEEVSLQGQEVAQALGEAQRVERAAVKREAWRRAALAEPEGRTAEAKVVARPGMVEAAAGLQA
jgi:hypothetical protein